MRFQPARITLAAVLLVVGLALAGSSPAVGQTLTPVAYLPIISRANTNPIHTGIATYYYATGAGACGFAATPGDLMVAAMNAEEFNGSAVCGSYIRVNGAKGEVTVRIVDLCPECKAGHLDLSQQAFAAIDDLYKGRVDITWQLVSPEMSGPVVYHFKDGANQWWTAVQMRNHRNPIAKFEFRNASGVWVNVPRTTYNYFVQTNPGMGEGPFTFRVTDLYGNVLIDSGVPLLEDADYAGAGQFPYGP
ncbi:MAG: hypothetical protein JW987_00690 [Anaerolineaceae bacterium]|nr:hypothetical protein [Anaerolineaceae bacterium]